MFFVTCYKMTITSPFLGTTLRCYAQLCSIRKCVHMSRLGICLSHYVVSSKNLQFEVRQFKKVWRIQSSFFTPAHSKTFWSSPMALLDFCIHRALTFLICWFCNRNWRLASDKIGKWLRRFVGKQHRALWLPTQLLSFSVCTNHF